MSGPDVDEVLNYLSIKFNKIFCDREFVCCVIEDFQTILENKARICVLVFPTLGPIYLKALRYQARIFDLAVFNITSASGKFRSIAVCHKDHLKKQNKEEIMPESSKRKRPERQLYVPPAQRASRLSKSDKKVTEPGHKSTRNDPSAISDECLLNLSDVLNLLYFFNPILCNFRNLTKSRYQHTNCQFKKLLNFQKFAAFRYHNFIKIYQLFLSDVYWDLNQLQCTNPRRDGYFQTYPIYDFDDFQAQAEKPSAVLVNQEANDFAQIVNGLPEVENNLYKIECDNDCDSGNCIVDLSVIKLGHFFIISMENGDYFYECQEQHDPTICCGNVRNQLETSKKLEKLNISAIKSENETNKNGTPKSNKDVIKNQINMNKKKVSDNTHEQEKEIMRMTKEYINRKTRPIMKYVDDSNDTLRIDKNDSVNNWEDLFDDNGQIQEELLTEIVDKVGDDITIVKASEDYTAYTNKPPEELEHVVELYNFPATLETHDLVQAFSEINSDAMYIKWVDDTHALLVLGSLSQAQKAVNMRNPLIKVRPMTAASAISMDVANKSDLKPAMKRPPTNLQTARRLITTHLGTKSKLTKEQIAKEKQDLKNAREMKRLLKQNEKDAWEGKLRSSVN
ncbi:uncharacterized protein LOC123006064 [Tribolium madens]|uniref:uncharacterized protein LOC123006064 n=1 Tax=Tribolium madens TaxID=41895 RepID=UPI001CF72789|nr:uncharacterized protein LOC123006064 [Tribolium madens]